MAGRVSSTVAVISLALGVWAACSNYDGAEAPRGSADQVCFENGTCFEGLICFAGRCVSKDYFDGGGSTSSSTSSSASSGSSSSSSSSSSGSVPTVYKAFFSADCDRLLKCSPGSFKDKDACMRSRESSLLPLPGLAVPTEAQVSACVEKLRSLQTCDGLRALPECVLAGTLPIGAPCFLLTQCASGACGRSDATDECGKCAPAVPRDGACDYVGKLCVPELFCIVGKCRDPLAKDAECSGGAGAFCGADTTCVYDSSCTTGLSAGSACDADADCAVPLICGGDGSTTNKCVHRATKDLGAGCDPARKDICKDSRCDPATKKCLPYAKAGESCPTGTFDCEPGLACVKNKCATPSAPSCTD